MSFSFRPLGLFAVLVATACSTTMVSDKSAFKPDWKDPELAGLEVNSRAASRSPASEVSAWANVPGFIDPNASELLEKDPGVKADPRDPIEYGTPSQLMKNVYIKTEGGKKSINLDAIQKKIDALSYLANEASKVPEVSSRALKALSVAKIVLENAKSEGAKINADTSIDLSKVEGLNSKKMQPFYSNLFQGLEMVDIARSENPEYGKYWNRIFMSLKYFETFEVKDRLEAMNLDVPADLRTKYGLSQEQAFFHPSQLKTKGIDVSKLDPVDSGMWKRNTAISEFKTDRYNIETTTPEYAELAAPSRVVSATFDEVSTSGSTAKFDAKIVVNGEEKKFKVKFRTRAPRSTSGSNIVASTVNFLKQSAETSTETTVNNLAAALGYSISPTYHKDYIKLYLKNDGSKQVKEASRGRSNDEVRIAVMTEFNKRRNELVDKLLHEGVTSSMLEANWDYANAMSEVAYDENLDRGYIKLKDVSLEERPPTKFGMPLKSNFGRGVKREFRAFSLFLAWISDDDNSDRNSDARYTYDESSKRVRIEYVSSDMGSALGFFYSKDAPHAFTPNLVAPKSKGPNDFSLTYRTRHFSPIFNRVSTADAKWFVRQLAQLTEQQIGDALTAGGYEACTADVFKNKLMRRRDQLVSILKLDETEGVKLFNPANKNLSSAYNYKPSATCGRFFIGDKRKATPTLDTNAHDMAFNTLGDADSPQRDFVNALKSHVYAMGANWIGHAMQRFALRGGQGMLSGAANTDPNAKAGFFDGFIERTGAKVYLMPARFIMLNPFRDQSDPSSPPYWIVGVSRVGVGLSSLRAIPNAESTFRSLTKFNFDVSTMVIRERIEVQPAFSDDVAQATKHYYQVLDPSNIFAAFTGIHDKTVESLTSDSSLVVTSTYAVVGTSIRSALGLMVTGPFIGLGTSAQTVNRTALIGQDANNVFAFRSVGKGAELKGEAGVAALIFNIPVAQFSGHKTTERQVAYRLTRDQATSGDLLDGILHEDVEDLGKNGNQFAKYLVTERDVDRTGSLLALKMGGFSNWYRQNERTIISHATKGNKNVVQQIDQRIRGSGKGQTWQDRGLVRDDFSVSGVLVSGQSVESTTNWNYKRVATTQRDLAKYANRVFPVFPMSLRPIDYNDTRVVNNNLQTIEFEGYVSISQTGWNKILSKKVDTVAEKIDLCNKWMNVVDFDRLFPASRNDSRNDTDIALVKSFCARIDAFVPTSGAHEKIYRELVASAVETGKVRDLAWNLRLFLDRFSKATKAHASAAAGGKGEKLRDAIVDLIYIKEYPEFVVKVLQSMMSCDDYYQYGILKSDAEGGIVLQAEKIEVAKGERCGLNADRADEIRRPKLVLNDYAQRAMDALDANHVFYDYFYMERVGNRLRLTDMLDVYDTVGDRR